MALFQIVPINLQHRLTRVLILPGVLMLTLAGVSSWQISRLLEVTQWVNHTNTVIAQANLLQKLLVDMETGLRGYLVTGDAVFLEPYTQASLTIDPVFNEFERLTSDNIQQQQRIRGLYQDYRRWKSYSSYMLKLKKSGKGYQISSINAVGKEQMDIMRRRVASLIQTEERLRQQRTQVATQTARLVFTSSAGLSLLVGSILAFFIRHQINVVSRSYKYAFNAVQDQTKALQENEQQLQAILDGSTAAIYLKDIQGRYIKVNRQFETLFHGRGEVIEGKTDYDLFSQEIADALRENDLKVIEGGTASVYEETMLQDGELRTYLSTKSPLKGYGDVIYAICGISTDISDRKRAEEALRESEQRLAWHSRHDGLTGLPNRWEFEQRLKLALSSAKAHHHQHSLCFLDLDQFKIVNDTCGHAAGDELLRQVTALFTKQVRATDTLARLGGDEFGLLLNQCPLNHSLRIANMLRQSLQEFRFIWQDKTFTIGVSIGLVAINADTLDLSSILSAADMACYAAKNAGRNRVHVYQADDQDVAIGRGQMQWISRLTKALQSNSFCLYSQPIVPLAPAESRGKHYEILLRLVDDTGKLVPPMAFIPAAERYNLMHLIDRWVISTFFASFAQHCQETGQCCLELCCSTTYAINLSGASINDDSFTDFLVQQFTLYSVPPQVICFEITETIAISNLNKAGELISKLKQLGCRFALDDFGSGMSSFAYLKNLPVDYLKIDGEFIKDIVDDPTDLALTQAINQVGHAMGIQTIAEFVENDSILEKISELGVDYAQGYGIAKPQLLQFN